jgi:serine/threonine-protein kinase
MSMPEIAPVREGEILDHKYRVDRVLGVGGMGVVVAATHVQLNTKVALKFLLPAAMTNAQVIERFAREARAAVQIQSEHVARVTDVGTLPTGSPYMVMEFLEGGDLADVVGKTGPLPVATSVSYVLEACEAIAEAHSLGIIHRDLKPANLFLAKKAGRDPVVKVLDFGISKTKEAGSTGGLTATTAVMGSPFYMAPEQMMSSKDVDARVDIWALGVILYELLTGVPPFAADSMPEVVFLVTQRDPEPLQIKRPDAPPGLVAAVSRCLMRDRNQRFQNVAEFAAAIAPFGPARSEVSVERVSRLLGTDPAAAARVSAARVSADFGGARDPMRPPATSSSWANNSQSGAGARSQSETAPRQPKTVMYVAIGSAAALVGILAVVGLGMRGGSSKASSPAPSAESDTSAKAAAVVAASAVAPVASAALAPLPPPPTPSVPEAVTLAPSATAATTTAPPAHPAAGPRKAATPPQQPPATQAAAATPPPPRNGLNMGMKE